MTTKTPPAPAAAPPKAYLEEKLADLVRKAEKFPGIPARVELSRGLRISLLYHATQDVWRLQLDRADSFPSVHEWETVLNHFPGGAAQQVDEAIKAGQDGGRYWWHARIQLPPRMI